MTESMITPIELVTNDKETSETSSSTKDNQYSSIDDKVLKKKMKKERQKDKKNRGKEKTSESEDTNKCESVASAKDEQKEEEDEMLVEEKKNDNNNKGGSVIDVEGENADIDFSLEVPAFIRSIVSQKDTIKMQAKRAKDSIKDTNHKADNTFLLDDSDGFTGVKKVKNVEENNWLVPMTRSETFGTKQAPASFCKTPEGFGNRALLVIRSGNFPLAINYLTRAIALDRSDARHYINRSYCYLRNGDYELALEDIKFASKHFTDLTELAKAKCREGQALCGLQNYKDAELAFKDCINLSPNCAYAERELKRMQVLQMVCMGFNERDALLALQKKSDTEDAINLLMEFPPNDNQYDSTESVSDDEIFYSDSEENPSNERLFSKILNYDPNLSEEPIVHESPACNKTINNIKQAPRAQSADRTMRVIKTVVPSGKLKKNDPSINEMAVWVGNVNSQITDSMLQKRFAKFGKVTSVWRPANVSYVFVNFQCPTSSQKVIEEANYNSGHIDMNGFLLPIKPAAAKKSK